MSQIKTIRGCPACNTHDGRNLGEKNGFDIIVCGACKSLYTDRVPVATESENYDEYYGESNLSVPNFILKRLAEIIGEFEGSRKANRLLDVGFGAGTMLEVAKDMGWVVSGIEVSRPAAEQARERGFDVFLGGLRDAKYPDNHFDVVTASEILEHMPEPVADLKEIVRILRPGGLFWATTPHANGLSFKILKLDWSVMSPPEHIQLYSKAGTRKMLKEAGFNSINLQTHGLNPSEIRDHFTTKRADDESFDRVNTSYALNESFTKSPIRKTVKSVLNGVLNISSAGDSLKIWARKN